jgi:hypothetical protein
MRLFHEVIRTVHADGIKLGADNDRAKCIDITNRILGLLPRKPTNNMLSDEINDFTHDETRLNEYCMAAYRRGYQSALTGLLDAGEQIMAQMKMAPAITSYHFEIALGLALKSVFENSLPLDKP